MKPIVILSNLEEEDARIEDLYLTNELNKYMQTTIQDLFEDEFSHESFYLVRNIWGHPHGRERMLSLYESFDDLNIPYVNSFNGKGDQQGKTYLIELFNLGELVIPTYDSIQLAIRTDHKNFIIKPIHGGSSKGVQKISRDKLQSLSLENQIIQPYFDIDHEISFYYINSQFQYALKTTSSRWDLELYYPTKQEFEISQRFANWNPVIGIQRVDFIKTSDGKFLLLEIEDWCPYLSLCDVKEIPINTFIGNMVHMLKEFE